MSRARAAEIVAYHRGLMSVYCAANLRARSGPEVPAVLREQPAIEVPSILREPGTDVPIAASSNGHPSEPSISALRSGVAGGTS